MGLVLVVVVRFFDGSVTDRVLSTRVEEGVEGMYLRVDGSGVGKGGRLGRPSPLTCARVLASTSRS